MLTKTVYLAYVQCPKQFWLDIFQPELASTLDLATQRRLRIGQEVDKQARAQYPQGSLIPYRPHTEDMVSLTVQTITEGAQILFQATFAEKDLLVKVDILKKNKVGWHLLEVKSSTRYKPDEHLPDIAFQVYVLQQAGLNVTQTSLMHLNSEYRHPNSTNLFVETDVTEEVWAYLPQVAIDVDIMRQLVSQLETPQIHIGRQCTKPYECSFYTHCWSGIEGWTIYDVPFLKRLHEQKLETANILYVSDIPSGFESGDKRATSFVERVTQKKIIIDQKAIQSELKNLIYPLYFFDFETIDYAIPAFDGCKPYQQVPFQYSCHILHADGTLSHCDFLHTTPSDPRLALVKALLDHIGDIGNIIAYNIPFERRVLLELAEQFPQYAARLRDRVDRLWDQLGIFRKHYQHYNFGKSNSLKSVLPVVVPELSYQVLEMQNGVEAQVVWEEMIVCEDLSLKNQLAEQLRAYCHLDTLAMVKIHQVLTQV